MGLLTHLLHPQRLFRPEVEAMLDAEMARHRQAIARLTEYALQQETKRQERASGGSRGNQGLAGPADDPGCPPVV